MELFHTSGQKITSIDSAGRFGEFLFFSWKPYFMTSKATVYSIEIDDDSIIKAGGIFYHDDAEKLAPLVAEFAARFDVDTDTAEEIISERQELEGHDADDSWDVQRFTARAAKILGFRGVAVTDEQGGAYMIDMAGRHADLAEVAAE